MNKIDAHQCLYQAKGFISSYIRNLRCCYLCFYVVLWEIQSWSKFNTYIHISFTKTLEPFGIYSLLFSLSFSRSLFLSFSVSFQNTSIYSLLERTQMLKYANAGLSVILKKGYLFRWPYKIKTVRGVLRIWVTTASVMTYAWVTTQS